MAMKGMLTQAKDVARKSKRRQAPETTETLLGEKSGDATSPWFSWTAAQVFGSAHTAASRFRLFLPASKKHVECHAVVIDPRQTFASASNPRNQQLLSLSDPNIERLIEDMKGIPEEGILTRQRDPVLVNRPNDEGLYEVIYGTRRRFAAEHLCETQLDEGGFPLIAWVPAESISPADKSQLAIEENEDREDLSSWEKAQLAARLDEEGLKNAAIAHVLRIHEKKVPEYKKAAAVPLAIVGLLRSPSEFTIEGAKRLMKLANEEGGFDVVQSRLESKAMAFESMKLLLAAAVPPKVKSEPALKTRGKQVIKDASGATRFQVGWVRGKDQLKIDAFGVSDEDASALIAALESMASTKG